MAFPQTSGTMAKEPGPSEPWSIDRLSSPTGTRWRPVLAQSGVAGVRSKLQSGLAIEQGLHGYEENRNHQQRQNDHSGHPAHDDCAEGLLAFGARTSRDCHRCNAEDERKTGHHNGTEAHTAGLDGRFPDRAPLFAQSFGEFDDQNAVLGGEPDDGHDDDGEIDVVRQPAQHRRRYRAQYAERYG